MEILLKRIKSNDKATIGEFYINSKFNCYSCEDEYREVKVKGETRIPAGRYEVKLRTVGRLHETYSKKFPEFHIGMLEITGIPNFTAVCIHIGTSEKDTDGCPLTGKVVNGFGVLQSTIAYIDFYKTVIPAFEKEQVFITVLDEGQSIIVE